MVITVESSSENIKNIFINIKQRYSRQRISAFKKVAAKVKNVKVTWMEVRYCELIKL